MKTKKDGDTTIRFAALILLLCACTFAMEYVSTARTYADCASDKSKGPVGQANEKGIITKGFVKNIEGITVKNEDFRQVLYTAKNSNLLSWH